MAKVSEKYIQHGEKFYTKSGYLTEYALYCGYVEKASNTDSLCCILSHDGGIVFHVKLYDFKNQRRMDWEAFEKLTDARRLFEKLCKTYKLKHE